MGLDAALLTHPHHVFYFTNYWTRGLFAPGALVQTEGDVVLSAPADPVDPTAADKVVLYEADRYCTLVDDQPAMSLTPLLPMMGSFGRIGCDDPRRPWALQPQIVDLNQVLYTLRRHKDPDEIDMIRRCIVGCEAAYAAAHELLEPGVTELQVFSTMQAAAVQAVGEPIGEMGNDFRSGEPGGGPRQRAAEAGELYILDVGIVVRGYTCDLCRTFAVDGKPTEPQQQAQARIMEAMHHVESTVRPGVGCRQLFDQVHEILDGYQQWKFFHHLGHGIGLFAHEAPRLNPNWDDTFETGDVFTAEPGLYGDNLRAGIRIEHNYLVTEDGLERLSNYPTDL